MQREHRIRCLLSRDAQGASEDWLGLEIDGVKREIKLRIWELAERLVHDLSPLILDLIEIAACVYGADSAIPRGGPMDQGMGKLWRRSLRFEIPVREPDLWNSTPVKSILTEMLGFLSDDSYDFYFALNAAPRQVDGYLAFGEDRSFDAGEVVLFSGGLDSLAGALDELMARRRSVVLVSHHSANKIKRVQRDLVRDLQMKAGAARILHVPVAAHLKTGSNREATHRTRSFLFAALGIATARIFGRNRLRFYENGVVSLNLPPVGQVVGARATRTTHPQALAGFGRLFSVLFARQVTVENPFIWKTKREVVDLIAQYDATDLIRASRSCADVRNSTNYKPHCGRCSQCIDRRFAILAAGLESHDPEESYAVDLFRGPRTEVRDREMALAYVRQARRLKAITPVDFMANFGEVNRALRYFDEPADAVARRIHELHRRHDETVSGVMDRALGKAVTRSATHALDPDCLLRLAGADVFGGVATDPQTSVDAGSTSLPAGEVMTPFVDSTRNEGNFELLVLGDGAKVEITGLGMTHGATAEVLATLAEKHLGAAGQGLHTGDYPCTEARVLGRKWGLDGEEAVRKRINRARGLIKGMATRAGHPGLEPDAIVANSPWHGYRLNPWRVTVFRRQ